MDGITSDRTSLQFKVRDFREADMPALGDLALCAFEQYRLLYDDWPAFRSRLPDYMADIAAKGELIVAERDGTVLGAVGYMGPHKPKAAFFDQAWPIMRMLVVLPEARGQGIAKALAQQCIARARRDRAPVIALHTSPMMKIALPMYLRMGFRHYRSVPPIYGVEYDIYLLPLDPE